MEVESLSVENTVWANTVVASGNLFEIFYLKIIMIGRLIGIVIYTGYETRSVMNTSMPSTKVGLLDLEINRLSKVFFFYELIFF